LHKINCLARISESLPGLADGADFFLESHFDRGSAGTYHARAMGNPLQDRRTPLELAASRQVIEFKDRAGKSLNLKIISMILRDWRGLSRMILARSTLINSRSAGAKLKLVAD
jgi:hypothetical protein